MVCFPKSGHNYLQNLNNILNWEGIRITFNYAYGFPSIAILDEFKSSAIHIGELGDYNYA